MNRVNGGYIIDPKSPNDISVVKIMAYENVVIPKSGQLPISLKVSHGTGTIISPDGIVLTARHVVENQRVLAVWVQTLGLIYPAEVVYKDDNSDFAFLYIRGTFNSKYTALPKESIDINRGDDITVHGYPMDPIENKVAVTWGKISRFSDNYNLWQVDAAVNPGNSGGPVVNKDGKIIGIVVSKRAGAEGMNYILSVNRIITAYYELRESNKMKDVMEKVERLSSEEREIKSLLAKFIAKVTMAQNPLSFIPILLSEKENMDVIYKLSNPEIYKNSSEVADFAVVASVLMYYGSLATQNREEKVNYLNLSERFAQIAINRDPSIINSGDFATYYEYLKKISVGPDLENNIDGDMGRNQDTNRNIYSNCSTDQAPRKYFITCVEVSDDEGEIVTIDVGKNNTKPGDIYNIYAKPISGEFRDKQGNPINKYENLVKGKVMIIATGESSSKGRIIFKEPAQSIEKGDMVVFYKRGTIKMTSLETLQPGSQIGEKIYFKTDSDEIDAKSYESLEEIAYIINCYPEQKFQINAHADSRGSEINNRNLADRRARSVYNALVKNFGVDAEQLEIVNLSEIYNAKGAGLRDMWDKSRRAYVIVSFKGEMYTNCPFSVHASSYKTYEQALTEVNLLRSRGIEDDIYIVPIKYSDTGCWFQTMIGCYPTSQEANKMLKRIKDFPDIKDPIVIEARYTILIDYFKSKKDAELAKAKIEKENNYYSPYIKYDGEKYLLLAGAYRNVKDAKILVHHFQKNKKEHKVILR